MACRTRSLAAACVCALAVSPLQTPAQSPAAMRALAHSYYEWRDSVSPVIYLISGFVLGLAGGYLALFAAGGTIARLGFFILAGATVATLASGYVSIRRRDITQHREWMLRSYALIFGAVTLRIWLPLLIIAYHGEFLPAYRWVAWLSWVPNILWAEWRIRRGWRPAFDHPDSATLSTA